MISNHEVFENLVASVVDIVSVMVAYTIGITQSSVLLGLAYGIFDAIIVVWMRKPLSQFVRKLVRLGIGQASPSDRYVADIP
jgi:hypothetical protein